MAVFAGPMVYFSDGFAESLSLLPQVAAFASAISANTLVARMKRSAETPTDSRFTAALGAISPVPQVIDLPRRKLGAALAAVPEVRGGVLVVGPRRGVGSPSSGLLLRETILPLLTLPADGKIGTVRRVLFPADLAPRSLPALDATIELCRTLGASLDVLHVYGEDRLLSSEVDQAKRAAAQSPRELFNIHKQAIAELASRAEADGVNATTQTAEGRAHANILNYTSSNPIDLVVMATHGPRTFEDVLRGTTTARVVRRSPVPVLVLRA